MTDTRITPANTSVEFRKKPVTIVATQWWQNGDHPGDHLPFDKGDPARYADYVFDTEGKIVRRYNTPNMDGKTLCKHCGNSMRQHGWIDTLEGGHIVCPGDVVITGVKGERYPCKPDIFLATYEAALAAPQPEAQPVPPVKLTDAQITSAAKSLGIGSYQTLAAAFKAGVKFAETDALMPVLTDAEIVDAIEHLYQNRAVAEMAAKVGMDDYRAIEAAVRTGGAG